MFAHLHVRSWFSFLAGASSPETLAQAAAANEVFALATTDRDGVYGAVRHQAACQAAGVHPVFGAEVVIGSAPLVLLARSRQGYANLCRILTAAHRLKAAGQSLRLAHVYPFREELVCLTGGREGLLSRLLESKRPHSAARWLEHLEACFPSALYIELTHQLRPNDSRLLRALHGLAVEQGLPVVATGDVRYATPDDYARYDLQTCIRLNHTVFEPHPDRPYNDRAFLQSEKQLRRLIPFPEAFENSVRIARACQVDLFPEAITPPSAVLPPKTSARNHLRRLCYDVLPRRYTAEDRPRALTQLKKELSVIEGLHLEEFFLIVHEVVEEARRRDIRCAGRGSAANSIVAYLLGITGVDPLAHNLLFERFLHGGRKGTPDIDVDFDTDRRNEIISWMEQRFGIEQTAMTATLVTYQLRSALRDVAKALGFSTETMNRMAKAVPHRRARQIRDYAPVLRNVAGASPLLDRLVDMVEALDGCPRHLGLHSGGMVLSQKPLYFFSPVQTSANGVKVVQFDKYDVEALGLVKFDVLGLRMLSAVSHAAELVRLNEGIDLDIDQIPLDNQLVFNMIRAGKTIGLFQIESQGQLHLLAMNQPEDFNDLIIEIALFRPGPVQGGMVKPFVRRRRGQEEAQFEHPDLEPLLGDTYGIIVFQEQVLQVAHHFAGMTLEEADDFRSLMSRFRSPDDMEAMRDRFVTGAVSRGVAPQIANNVFDKVAKFVGFGFCRSHAAAFAKTVYQSAYLKRFHPAAYMAAVLEFHPGMYPRMTLEEEARRFGVSILLPDINRSSVLHDVEQTREQAWAVRKPLSSVAQVSMEDARTIVWERLNGRFVSVEDFYVRTPLNKDSIESLARSGALDSLTTDSRTALWEVGVLANKHGAPGERSAQQALFKQSILDIDDLPSLPALDISDRLSWDYLTHGSARMHPMLLVRRALNALEVRPIETCFRFPQSPQSASASLPVITTAGVCILRQRPPTAKGFMFITLEDETGFVQCVVPPPVQEYLDHVLTASALIVRGTLQATGNWRGLIMQQAWILNGIFGGYEGFAGTYGGQDRWVRSLRSGGLPSAAARVGVRGASLAGISLNP
ncbi:MAG: DNA polymerase III subunit alpha [Rhodothermales bacterium]